MFLQQLYKKERKMSFNSEEEIQKERSKWKLTDEELSSNF